MATTIPLQHKPELTSPQHDVASAAMNAVELMPTWLTPTVLFCFLNLMIGTIFFRSTLNPLKKDQNLGDEHRPRQLAGVPAIFQRLKSFNRNVNPPDPIRHESEEHVHHVTRTQSDAVTMTMTAPAPAPAPAPRVLKRSASEKMPVEKAEVAERRPATVREKPVTVDDEAVDAKADDFINKFRQQLKLQRLDSILRYKEILNRGTAR